MVFWRNKHDDPMFSLHKMIAYMLLDIILRFEELVNFEKETMSIFLINQMFYLFHLPVYIYM